MTEDVGRKYALLSLLRIIYGISDIEYQRRVWIRAEGPECDDYCETVNNFFSFIKEVLGEHSKYDLTESQFDALLNFSSDFEYFNDNHDCPMEPVEQPDTPEWATIREEAKEVLKTFNYQHRPAYPGDPWGLLAEA